jgi:hypothetical protein
VGEKVGSRHRTVVEASSFFIGWTELSMASSGTTETNKKTNTHKHKIKDQHSSKI